MSEKLLPCPFCGGNVAVWPIDKIEGLRIIHELKHPYYRAVCQGGCGCVLGDFDTREEAIEAWNRRALPTCSECEHAERYDNVANVWCTELIEWRTSDFSCNHGTRRRDA